MRHFKKFILEKFKINSASINKNIENKHKHKPNTNITVEEFIDSYFNFLNINCTLNDINKTNLSKILSINKMNDWNYNVDLYTNQKIDLDKLIKHLQSKAEEDTLLSYRFNDHGKDYLKISLKNGSIDNSIEFFFKCKNLRQAIKFFEDKFNIKMYQA